MENGNMPTLVTMLQHRLEEATATVVASI